jgi:Mat/Ecp fimbriae major subunit
MKFQMIKAALATAVIATVAMGATSAHAATANASARAKVLRAVTIANDAGTSLQFGTILPGATASTVVVDTAGARTLCGPGLVCTSTTDAADFTITGTSGQIVLVSVPASVTLADGLNTMVASLNSSNATGLVTMSALNSGAVSVGGTLAVGANQAEGDYVGTFTVTANYQ